MTDFASLALKIDSSGVQTGVKELDKLTMSGAKAEKAIDRLGDTAAQTGTQLKGAGIAASEYAAAAQRSAAGATKMGESGKLAAHHIQNLTFQANDLFVGLASGQKPMTVFMQQGTQIAQIMQQAGVGVGGLARQLLSMGASAVRAHPILAGLTVVAGAAAGAFELFSREIDKSGELKRYADGLGLTHKEMEKLGPISITAGDAVKGLWKTISDGLGLDKVFSSISSFAVDAFKWMLHAGEVAAAGIYAGFVGTYRGISAVWGNLPSVLGEAVIGAANLAASGLEMLVNNAIDGLNKLLSLVNPLLSAAGMGGAGLGIGHVAFGRFANPFAGASANAAGAFANAYSGAYREAMSGMNGFGETLGDNIIGAAKARIKAQADDIIDDRTARSAGGKKGKAFGEEFANGALEYIRNSFAEAGVFIDKSIGQKIAQGADLSAMMETDVVKAHTKQVMDAHDAYVTAAQATDEWRNSVSALGESFARLGGVGGVIGGALGLLSGDTRNLSPNASYLAQWSGLRVRTGEDGKQFVEAFGRKLTDVFGDNGKFFQALQKGGAGMAISSMVFGNSAGSNAGSFIGGAFGEAAFKKLAPSLFKKLGDFAGPLGTIVGGLIGGLIGGLFKKTKYGTSVVGSGTASGNSAEMSGNATGAASGIASMLDNIATQLGGGVGGYNVSIGQVDGKWRVSTSGRSGKLLTKYGDVKDFGKEGADAAIRYAIADAIRDGAITGIKASVQNLISAGGDIEKQLAKALKFQGVFDELQSKTDPLAYSLGQVAKEAAALNKIFAEAGASAEEYAQLEQLLALKRTEAAEQAKRDIIDKMRDPYQLQIQILELLGKSEDALAASRLIELAGLKDTLQPLQSMVYQLQDARKVIDTFQPLADDLKAYRSELLGGGQASSFGFLAAKFRETAIAAGNGDATGLGNLRGAASSFLDAAKANATSALEYQRAQAEVMRAVDKGIFAAETQVDYAQAQIDATVNVANIMADMKAEMATLQAQVVQNTGFVAQMFRRFDGNTGLLVATTQDEPVEVRVVS